MLRYTLKRILLIIPIVFVIIFLLFLMLYATPASAIRSISIHRGGDALDSFFEATNASDNIFTKYIRYCYNILVHFDFGRSRMVNQLAHRIRNTIKLLVTGVGATLIIGIPIGIFTATHKNRLSDRIVNIVTLVFSAIPNYALAILLTLILCLRLGLLPLIPSYTEPIAFVLPTLVISLGGIASVSRMTKASMLEVLGQQYITALRSKGLGSVRILYSHALKNALVPIIAVAGGLVSQLLCGTLVVEFFFNVPGLGSLMLDSVANRSHFETLGCTAILTLILAVSSVIVDVSYALINPQIKLRYVKSYGLLKQFRKLGAREPAGEI
ncbi:MAG: ABC transporter permease [Oscillospiraceae bacterium]|nr:ABC transporter permease [Oscillospiraceae bacterium]